MVPTPEPGEPATAEYLRCSNGSPTPARLGDAPETSRHGRPRPIQEIRSSNAQYLCGTQPKPNDPATRSSPSSRLDFEYHPTHNHWHTADVARFEVRKGTTTGRSWANSIKVGFLLDLYNLEGNAPTSEKVFWDCYTSYQGFVGWVDQYHQATDGQQVELTGVPNATDYYLVSTTNPTGFLEQTRRTTPRG